MSPNPDLAVMTGPPPAVGCLCGAFVSGPLITRDAALFTDLYELTMAASYFRERMHGPATFSLFVRRLPPRRSFLIAAGLEEVLRFLERFEYKVATYDGRDVLKLSPGKATWPGEKQVYRLRAADGSFARDVLARRDEKAPAAAEPLLRTVMSGGHRVESAPALSAIRARCAEQVAALPAALRRPTTDEGYVVEPSPSLLALRRSLEARAEATEVLAFQRP